MTEPGDAEWGDELRRRNASAAQRLVDAAHRVDADDLRGALRLQRQAERALRLGDWLEKENTGPLYVPPRLHVLAHAGRRELLRRELMRRNIIAGAYLGDATRSLDEGKLHLAFTQQKWARGTLRVGLMLRFGAWLDG